MKPDPEKIEQFWEVADQGVRFLGNFLLGLIGLWGVLILARQWKGGSVPPEDAESWIVLLFLGLVFFGISRLSVRKLLNPKK